jgi:hypothetical protein
MGCIVSVQSSAEFGCRGEETCRKNFVLYSSWHELQDYSEIVHKTGVEVREA